MSPKGSVGVAGLLGGQGAEGKGCWLGADVLWGPVQCGSVGSVWLPMVALSRKSPWMGLEVGDPEATGNVCVVCVLSLGPRHPVPTVEDSPSPPSVSTPMSVSVSPSPTTRNHTPPSTPAVCLFPPCPHHGRTPVSHVLYPACPRECVLPVGRRSCVPVRLCSSFSHHRAPRQCLA